MEILISGLNNYIARNFVTQMTNHGHQVTCLLSSKQQWNKSALRQLGVNVIYGDLLNTHPGSFAPPTIEVAYYFNQSPVYKRELSYELIAFQHFLDLIQHTACKQVIFVTRLTDKASKEFERILRRNNMTFTIVRVSNILGKDALLVDIIAKLSSQSLIFISKQFVERRCRPISLEDVCLYLDCFQLDPRCYGETIDLVGPEIVTYKKLYELYQELTKTTNKVINLPSWGQRFAVSMIESLYPGDAEVGIAFSTNLQIDMIKAHPSLSSWYPIEPKSLRQSLEESIFPTFDPMEITFHEWR
jgi:hypothetical protein